MHPAITEGIAHFNSRRFFEAHEVLEALWLTEQGEEKLFLHGLIQVAAAFHHYLRGNEEGFRSLLEKGARRMALCSKANCGINAKDFLNQLHPWLDAAQTQSDAAVALSLPVIRTL